MTVLYDLYQRLNYEERLFIWIALSCLVGATLFFFFLVISRIVKMRREAEAHVFHHGFQDDLNEIVFADDEITVTEKLSDLKKIIGNSTTGKQVLIDQIIALRKSLSGIAVNNIERVYRELGLFEFSLKKLSSNRWYRKAQGIHELAELDYEDAAKKIVPFLKSNNYALRDEAFMALLKLDMENPLSFLDDYPASVSFWMRMRIHHHLSHLDIRQLPDFSKWFTSKNSEVALFAMSMARQFRQLNTAPKLVSLLRSPDRSKVGVAVTALGDMETYEYANELVDIMDAHWADAKLSRRIARSLGKLISTEAHWNSVSKYLSHPDYTVRFEAAHAMQKSGKQNLLKANQASLHLESLVKHVEEPLLQAS